MSSPLLAWFTALRRRHAGQVEWPRWVAGCGVAVAAGLLCTHSAGLPPAGQVVAWSVGLLVCAVVLGRVWLRLTGPVFRYELVRTTRGGRVFLHRGLYTGLLLVCLCWFYLGWFTNRPGGPLAIFSRTSLDMHEAPRFAESFFTTFLAVQLLAVTLLTPAYTAGAIAGDRERGVLDFLLTTDLRNHEIVLGKLSACLARLLLVVLAGLPVVGLVQFLGGVDPNLVLAGFVLTATTMLSVGGFSILASVCAGRALGALVVTYVWVAIFLLCCSILPALSAFDNFKLAPPVAGRPASPRDPAGELLSQALAHGALAVCLCAAAVPLLRVPRRGPEMEAVEQLPHEGVARPPLPEPEPFRIRPPPVGEDPLLWKELHVERNSVLPPSLQPLVSSCLLLAAAGVIAALVGVFLAAYLSPDPYSGAGEIVPALGTVLACYVLLSVLVRAAGAVSRERERRTLDLLLTTLYTHAEVLSCKLLGSVASVRWAWGLLGLLWLLGLLSRALSTGGVVLMAAACGIYAAFMATLGLYCSTVSRTSVRATVSALLVVLAVMGGPVLLIGGGGRLLAAVLPRAVVAWAGRLEGMESPPPVVVWRLSTFRPNERVSGRDHDLPPALANVVCYGLATMLLWNRTRRRLLAEKGPPPRRRWP